MGEEHIATGFWAALEADLTKQDRLAMAEFFAERCAYCKEPLPKRWHADHLLSVDSGGFNTSAIECQLVCDVTNMKSVTWNGCCSWSARALAMSGCLGADAPGSRLDEDPQAIGVPCNFGAAHGLATRGRNVGSCNRCSMEETKVLQQEMVAHY